MLIIAIAGPSASGKSSITSTLIELLSERVSQPPAVIAEDAYYLDRSDWTFEQRQQINFDHPSELEHSLLAEHLQQLKRGEVAQIPEYDYHLHQRKVERNAQQQGEVLIVEGIHLLHQPALRSEFHLSVFVDVPQDICRARRLRRDVAERGRTEEFVLQQYQSYVEPMYYQFVEPAKLHADQVVDGRESPLENAQKIIGAIEHKLAN